MRRNSGITISDVMKMDCMENCKLVAGIKGSANRISRVNIMADPDILNWVDAGEFLLTTAYSFKKDDIEAQKSLIRECTKKGLAGIGIKVYPYLDSIPKEILALADQLNFPIIDLYHKIPLSDIMTPIFKEIFNQQASLLQRMEKVHEQMMNVVLSGGSIGDITKVVYDHLRNPIVVKIHSASQIITGFEALSQKLKKELLQNYHRYYEAEENKPTEIKYNESIEMIEGKHVKRIVMPIVVKNSVYGHIFVWSLETPFGGGDLSVLESASTTIALEVLKQLSVRDVENRYRSEFWEDLLSLDQNRKDKALEKAGLYKLNLEGHYTIVVMQLANHHGMVVEEILQAMSLLNNDVERLSEELKLKAFVVSKTESMHILLSISQGIKHREQLKVFCEQLEALLASRFPQATYQIGIGRSYGGLCQVYKSYIDAVKAIEGRDLIMEKNIVFFEQLGIYKILCQDVLKEELERFYEATLLPLVEYDRKKTTELVKTLEVYFQNNGNLKKLSDALFTHYNTTIYRLQRIQKITGMDLENHKDRLNLEIALKIKKLLKK